MDRVEASVSPSAPPMIADPAPFVVVKHAKPARGCDGSRPQGIKPPSGSSRPPVHSRWPGIDWSQPVRQIAAALHVSRQRVYQVMEAQGVPRHPWGTLRPRLLALDTTHLTLAEVAARVDCSIQYARTVLQKAGKRWRRPEGDAGNRYAMFAAWLRRQHAYTPGTIHGLCTRCRRVERVQRLRLDAVLTQSGGVARVLRRLESDPARAAKARRNALWNDRLAIRRYAEFLHRRLGPPATESGMSRSRTQDEKRA